MDVNAIAKRVAGRVAGKLKWDEQAPGHGSRFFDLMDGEKKIGESRLDLGVNPKKVLKTAGCEKLPEGPMRDNCEEKQDSAGDKKAAKGEVPEAFKKEWENKDKDNDGKENEPKPDFLKDKKASEIAERVAKRVTAVPDFPYAVISFGNNRVSFTIRKEEDGKPVTGANPYGNNPVKAIQGVLDLIKAHRVPSVNVEVLV